MIFSLHSLCCFLVLTNVWGLESDQCQTWLKTHLFNSTEIYSYNVTFPLIIFEEFNELNVNCKYLQYDAEIVKFYATNDILFENDLDLRNVMKLFKFNKKNDVKTILFQNIKGFNHKLTDFIPEIYYNNYKIIFNNLEFQFFLNGTQITTEMCSRENFNFKNLNIFGSLQDITLGFEIFYTKNVCPFIFMNTNLRRLVIKQITNSLIFRNQLEFIDINQTDNFDLNTTRLFMLKIQVVFDVVSIRLVNKFVFKNLVGLYISGQINEIQSDLFVFLNKIRFISINIENTRQFFHTGIKWMQSINKGLNVNLINITNTTISLNLIVNSRVIVNFAEDITVFGTVYNYPDEDFCLFKDFPHAQLVYPSITLTETVNCSCTLLWLIRYSKYYMNEDYTHYDEGLYWDYPIYFNLYSVRNCLHQNFNKLLSACNLETRLEGCFNKNETLYFSSFSTNANYVFLFKTLQYVIGVYVKPFFCVIGISTNLIVFFVVTNKKKKKNFNNSMYKHIKVNSVFNTLLCIINLISLMNLCIFPKLSYCSSIYKNKLSQYLKIYLIYLLGNSVKICCNCSYIAFSVSRFYLASSNPSGLFKKFQDLNQKKFYGITFLISLILSLFKVFQFKVNEFYSNFDLSFPFDAFSPKYCGSDYIQTYSPTCKIFNGLSIANNVINNIIFLVLNFVVDILMIRFTKENLKRKRDVSSDEHACADAVKLKVKVKKMIIANGILYFFSHIPEFSVTILLIIFSRKLWEFCFSFYSCNDLVEISEAFNFLSIIFQIFIFLKFDKNFKESFKDVFKRKK